MTKGPSSAYRILLAVAFVAMAALLVLLIRQNRELKAAMAALQAAADETPEQTPLTLLESGDTVTPLDIRDLDGNPVRVGYDADQGDTVLLVFSPQCPACRQNVPSWNAMQEAHAGDSTTFYSVSGAAPEPTREFVAEAGVRGDVLVANADELRDYKVTHIPTTIVIGPGGIVKRVWVGILPDEALVPEAL